MRWHAPLLLKGTILVTIVIVLESLFCLSLVLMVQSREEHLARNRELQSILWHLQRLSSLTQDSGAAMVTSFIADGGQENSDLSQKLKGIPLEFDALKPLIARYPAEAQSLAQLEELSKTGIDSAEEVHQALRSGELSSKAGKLFKLKHLTDEGNARIRRLVLRFNDLSEEGLATEMKGYQNLSAALIAFTALNVVLISALAFLFWRSVARRLTALSENAARIGSDKALLPPLIGDDEMSQLDASLHETASTLYAAQRSERALIENALDVIFTLDDQLRFTAVNPAASLAWGFTGEELLGRLYSELVVSDQQEETTGALERMIKTGMVKSFENTLVRQDGSYIELFVSCRWSPAERSLFCITHEITERKKVEMLLLESEERLRAIMDYAPVAVLTLDEKHMIRSLNRTAAVMFRSSRDQLVGKRSDALIKNIKPPMVMSAMKQPLEIDARRQDGELFRTEITAAKVRTPDGQQYLLNVQDITPRQEAQRERQEILSTLDQQICRVIMSIDSRLENIPRIELTKHAQEQVNEASDDLIYALSFLQSLLDLERDDDGQFVLNRQLIRLSALIDRSVEAVSKLAQKRKVKMTVKSADIEIEADEEKLLQVLVVLLANALRLSPENSEVTISLNSQPEYVVVTVKDQGAGISAPEQRRVFQRTHRADQGGVRLAVAATLALPACKALVEKHGGAIGVNSEEERGNMFWFRIPRNSARAGEL